MELMFPIQNAKKTVIESFSYIETVSLPHLDGKLQLFPFLFLSSIWGEIGVSRMTKYMYDTCNCNISKHEWPHDLMTNYSTTHVHLRRVTN